jgi:hypothetical protein
MDNRAATQGRAGTENKVLRLWGMPFYGSKRTGVLVAKKTAAPG